MVRGFYMLGSGMLSQSRVLDAVSNNIANANTTGFKKSEVPTRTFGDMVIDRVDQQRTPIGDAALMNVAERAVTDYSEGDLKQTGRALDFAVNGNGFFAVQTPNGVQYTRNGSFNVDDQGYLVLAGKGQVLDANGQPIRPGTDAITSDSAGDIFANGALAGQLGVFDTPNDAALQTLGEGMFTGNGFTPVANQNILWEDLETSNVDMTKEMTTAMDSQRQFQNCSEALKMYDDTLDKAMNISRIGS